MTVPSTDRILDAAAAGIVEHGWRATSLTDIANRAGLSRPTVYKHAGDRVAIAAALLRRELAHFTTALAEVLAVHDHPRERFVEGLVFTVAHARDHAVFQRLLAEDPELVLPGLTRDAAPLLAQIVDLLAPYLEAALAEGQVRDVDPRIAAEWAARLGISLVLTPSVTTQLDDPVALRRFVGGLFTLGLSPADDR